MTFFLLLACVTETNFSNQLVAAACARTEECHRADFEAAYEDQHECVEDIEDFYDDLVDCYNEHCDFDAKEASDYLSGVRSATCDEADEALGEAQDVYDDCDEAELFLCLSPF